MIDNKKKFLFISEGYSSGSNHIIQLSAKKLLERGHDVQVLLRHGTVPNHINTLLPSPLYYDVELNQYIDQNPNDPDEETRKFKRHLDLNPDYLFFSHNSSTSYTDKNHVLSVLKFIPDYIIVGNRHNFLTYEDLDQLSNATEAMVYLIALDMSHFTGGCHFAWDCEGYKIGCDQISCPAMKDKDDDFISTKNFIEKRKIFERGNFRVIAGTEWTKNQIQKSKLFKDQRFIHNISAFIDVSIFNNKNRELARQVLELNNDYFYILAGSENPKDKRKGYAYFVDSMRLLWEMLPKNKRKKIIILSVSKYKNQAFQEIPFEKHHIEYIKDERLLSYLYQATDLYINTSIEDSGPSMLMEALVCGTPVASFNMGAANEFIEDGVNGYIVKLYDTKELARKIENYINLT